MTERNSRNWGSRGFSSGTTKSNLRRSSVSFSQNSRPLEKPFARVLRVPSSKPLTFLHLSPTEVLTNDDTGDPKVR